MYNSQGCTICIESSLGLAVLYLIVFTSGPRRMHMSMCSDIMYSMLSFFSSFVMRVVNDRYCCWLMLEGKMQGED